MYMHDEDSSEVRVRTTSRCVTDLARGAPELLEAADSEQRTFQVLAEVAEYVIV